VTPTRVLHVLPHAGAGAQTYIDTLGALENYRFEIFELSASRSAPAAALSIAGRRPALIRAARRADVIHLHGEIASLSTLGLLARHRSVVTLHGLHLLRRLPAGVPARLGRAGMRAIVSAANATICVSGTERDDLGWLPDKLAAKLTVIHNGLALPPAPTRAHRAAARAALGLSEATMAVLYLGQLEPRKDPLTALRAAQRAHADDPRILLLVAGSGPSRGELEALAGDETRVLGQRSDVTQLLTAADVFVMPSEREGLSYAVLEAMAHGVATVVSDGPGNPEAVGSAGLVFGFGDAGRLAELLRGLAADPDRRAALGELGRERVATSFSAHEMMRRTARVYEAALTAPGRRAAARSA
jgi:glycosyltransferase involved in cell wall biosynthesis